MSRKQPDSYDDWCVHYRGFMRPIDVPLEEATCEAGVRYLSVEVADVPGATNRLDRLPCFKRNGLPCPSQRFNTPEEAAFKRAAADASIAAFVNDLADDICPHCKTPVTKQVQVGRCVYAEPCGHRLFQGKAKTITQEQYEAIPEVMW